MASFQVKIGWKNMRKRKNKYYRSVPFRSYPTRNRKFQKKTIIASFQAKIVRKRMRKRENNNYCSVPFRPQA